LRIVLARLLCQPNVAVSTDSLIDAIWDRHPPRTAVKNMQVYVHQLRRLLGQHRVVSYPHGYAVHVDNGELDAETFEQLAGEGTQAVAAENVREGRELLVQALDLWRGPALADLAVVPALRAPIARLTERFLATVENRIEIDLALGLHPEVVAEAGVLVSSHPMRERLRGQHMVALYRCGLQSDALRVYDEGRRILAGELGVEPAETLQRIYLAILRGADPGPAIRRDPPPRGATKSSSVEPACGPAGPAYIAQLPADIPDFIGRLEPLGQMDAWAREGARIAPLLLTGGAGSGKTTLAVHWAHRYAARHGVGHLYVNMRGYSDDPPMQPIDVLSFFLRSLGIAPEHTPADLLDAAALYRSMLAHRHIIVVIDNANSVEQVRHLLPGGHDNRVVITSRDRLSGLVALVGVGRIEVERFSEHEALELLWRVVGEPRDDSSRVAGLDLARVCGHLPLALRVAAANLADGRYASVSDLVADVSDTGWPDALDLDSDANVGMKAAFDHSYHRLASDDQRLFRMLSLIPGPDFTADTAGALVSVPLHKATATVRRLVSAHLVEQLRPGRFSLHDLVHRYAREISSRLDGQPERDRGRQALYQYYSRGCDTAARVAHPHTPRMPSLAADHLDPGKVFAHHHAATQ